MEAQTIIGIDPGAQGGIALYNYKAGITAVKMPKSIDDLNDYLKYIKDTYEKPLCFLERVSKYRGDADAGGKQFGIDKMLANYERLKTVLTLCKIPFIEVAPISWQAGLKLRKKGESKTDRKNRYKAAAAKYYPEIKRVTLWSSDALCLVQFGRLKFNTDLNWITDKLTIEVQTELFN